MWKTLLGALLLVVAIQGITLSCSQKMTREEAQNADFVRPAKDLLTRENAFRRAERISNVQYHFSLRLFAENRDFEGKAKIDFDLRDSSQALSLDFVDGEVLGVSVNGKKVAVNYNGYYILLLPEHLTRGRQSVEIEYRHPYRTDGRGLHWFLDPEDGETYLYTQFEAWDFNKVFPGFDQPDLKANYTMDVDVPAHWQVISALRESQIDAVSEGRRRWVFPTSSLFSTYVFSLHAGPYKVWQEDTPFRVPLRIFARKSYAQHVEVAEWFKLTRLGLDFFESYFDYPYPFEKYDHILVPEFVFGAMENVGAVTVTEATQPRGRDKNRQEKMGFSNLVMHELAHHWFGNLVTMRWWDDIWLNESFADLMGHFATSKVTEYSDSMTRFSTSRKAWGYSEDRWVTTHPIVQDIPDTEAVMASIDGITYAKGAASLIQLSHLLGEENFRKGLVYYFATYARKNTQLENFIGALAQTLDRDLSGWTNQWLMHSGVNTLQANYTCTGGKLAELDIQQQPANASGVLREHSLDILLVLKNQRRVVQKISVGAQLHNPQTFPAETECPEFVLPNVSDHTFARLFFDDKSRRYLNTHLADFTDPVERGMIWRSLWESVIDGELPVTEVLDLALEHLPNEENASLLLSQGPYIRRAYRYLVVRPFVRDVSAELASEYRHKLETISWQLHAHKNAAIARFWFSLWNAVLHSESAQKNALKLLAQGELSEGDKWKVAGALVREGNPQAEKWVSRLSEQNTSSSSKLNRIIAEAQKPEIASKLRWIREVQDPASEYSYTQKRGILDELFPLGQEELNLQLKDQIFTPIPALASVLTPPLLQEYVSSLVPKECRAEAAARLQALASLPQMPDQVTKTLRKGAQSEMRCLKAQKQLD